MNGYERISAALRGDPTDKIPVMLHNFMMAAEEAGYSMGKFRENPRIIAESYIKSIEKYQFDGIYVDIDTATLAGSIGVPVEFPENEPARYSPNGLLKSCADVRTAKPVIVADYKYINIWLESVRLLKDYFGDEIMIRGNCDPAPFSLASALRGTQNWMTDLVMEEPASVHEVLDYCTEATTQFILLMAETGAHMVSNGDSVAGPEMVSPELYIEYALPYEKKVIDVAHKAGLTYVLHICGDVGLILDQLVLSGADGLDIDHKTDVNQAFEILHDKTTFFGNLDPSGVLALGTPDLVRKKTIELLNIYTKTNFFVLNSGCAIPSNAPSENIKTFVQTAREYR